MSEPDRPVRPAFIVSSDSVASTTHRYPNSDEEFGASRDLGRAAGLARIALHVHTLLPGQRTSLPHAESHEEELVYILDGEVDAWIDGVLHRVTKGDLVAFPSGTGICHTFLNNSEHTATLLVGGEISKAENRIFYPRNPERQAHRAADWWTDIPLGPQGPHDGKPG